MDSAADPPIEWAEKDVNADAKEKNESEPPLAGVVRISRGGWTVEAEPGVSAARLAECLRAVKRVCC